MSASRYFDRIAAVVVAIALLLTVFLMELGKGSITAEAMAEAVRMPYRQIFSQDDVMEIEISISEEDWEDMLEHPMEEEYKLCDVTVNGTTYTDAAIRTKGNTSLSQVAASDSNRYSFKIEFDHYDGNKTMEGLDKLVLNNLFCDASYVKEYIAYDIFNYIGVETPCYSFANITVNGDNIGCYLALEAMEDSFLKRVYGGQGQLYKPESAQAAGGGENRFGGREMNFQPERPEGEEGFGMPERPEGEEGFGMPEIPESREGFSGSGGSDLVYIDDNSESYGDIFDNAVFSVSQQDKLRLIEALYKLDAGEDLDSCTDVDACLRYFAAQTFIVNMDSYYSNLKHNYYLYENNGKITMLPWDLNLAFGGFQSSSATEAVNSAIDTPMNGWEEDRPLFSRLMETEEHQALYHQYLEEIVQGYVDSGRFQETLLSLRELIAPWVEKDATAFYSYEEFETAVDTLEKFVLLRAESVEKQLLGEIPSVTADRTEDTVLVDASHIDLKSMGVQGGDGEGGKGSRDGHMFGNGPMGRERGMTKQKDSSLEIEDKKSED